MNFLQVVLLGVIEGITEFLPISSTGHLLVAEHWLGRRSDVFNVVIQAGAILAVTLIYRRRLWDLCRGARDPASRDYALKLGASFLVTVVLGAAMKALGFELPEDVAPVAWALIVGGLWMIAAEHLASRRGDSSEVTWTTALVVGVAQIVAAVFPGTSRSGATIFAAMLCGTSNRAAATEFAFLVGIPTMYAASAKVLLDLALDGGLAGENWTDLGVAFVVATVTAFVAVRWLLRYIQTHRFTGFAVYRIALGLALLVWLGR